MATPSAPHFGRQARCELSITNNKPMHWSILSNSILYALIGVGIFVVAFMFIDKITPFHLWRELVEKQNTALAIVIGFTALGICVIVAAAIH